MSFFHARKWSTIFLDLSEPKIYIYKTVTVFSVSHKHCTAQRGFSFPSVPALTQFLYKHITQLTVLLLLLVIFIFTNSVNKLSSIIFKNVNVYVCQGKLIFTMCCNYSALGRGRFGWNMIRDTIKTRRLFFFPSRCYSSSIWHLYLLII